MTKKFAFYDYAQSIAFFAKCILTQCWKMQFFGPVPLEFWPNCNKMAEMGPKFWYFVTRLNRLHFSRNEFWHHVEKWCWNEIFRVIPWRMEQLEQWGLGLRTATIQVIDCRVSFFWKWPQSKCGHLPLLLLLWFPSCPSTTTTSAGAAAAASLGVAGRPTFDWAVRFPNVCDDIRNSGPDSVDPFTCIRFLTVYSTSGHPKIVGLLCNQVEFIGIGCQRCRNWVGYLHWKEIVTT